MSQRKIGFGLSRIDDDEWSWSVEMLREGETTWGTGSDSIASGCEYTKADAIVCIRIALAPYATIETATRLPF